MLLLEDALHIGQVQFHECATNPPAQLLGHLRRRDGVCALQVQAGQREKPAHDTQVTACVRLQCSRRARALSTGNACKHVVRSMIIPFMQAFRNKAVGLEMRDSEKRAHRVSVRKN